MRLSVLLETEGTYPYAGGGVSTWCHTLCRRLSDVDFHLIAITGSPNVSPRYALPGNVRKVHLLPLWGTEEPSEYTQPDHSFADTFGKRTATTDRVVRDEFLPLFKPLVAHLLAPKSIRPNGAVLVHKLYRYFQKHDYKETFRSRPVWEAFKNFVQRYYRAVDAPPDEQPSVFDLTTALRWLYNFLIPLSVPVPDTDVSHATVAGFSGLLGVVARREHGTPLLVTDHGVFARERYIAVSSEDLSFFAKRFLLNLSTFVTQLCYRSASQVSPVCDYNRRWERSLGADPEKIRTIYNGISPDVFVPTSKPEHTQDRPTVVAATHVFPLKDIETMIRSCQAARKHVPDVQYLTYGSLDVNPAYTKRCQALIDKLDLANHFQLAGFHPRPPKLYNEGDISILSSISEGFPYTVIESMSCGRPVVATDVGGVREALEGCGVVTQPRDAQALGEGVAQLLQNHTLRQRMGRLCRERVLLRFRLSSASKAYRDSYGRLAAQKQQVA